MYCWYEVLEDRDDVFCARTRCLPGMIPVMVIQHDAVVWRSMVRVSL